MNLEIASLLLILFSVIIIVWGIAVVHTLPGKIATKRNHSQVAAIEIMSYLGLLVFPPVDGGAHLVVPGAGQAEGNGGNEVAG